MKMVARSLHRPLGVALAAALVLAPTQAEARGWAGRAVLEYMAAEPGPAEGEKATSKVPLSNDPALEYKHGTQAYALGNYEQAVAHFERSYALSNHPYLLYNLGLAYQQWHGLSSDLGHLRKARRLFQNYLKALADDPKMDQEQRDDAQAAIAKIDEEIAEVEAGQRAGATSVTAEGPQDQATATGAPGTDQPQPDRKPVYKRGWFWGVVAVGVLAVAGGVTAGVLLSRRDEKGPELGTIGPTSTQVPTGLGLRF